MKLLRCLCIALLAATLLFAFCSCDGTLIEDPAQYGNYLKEKEFKKFATALLPEKLEDYFENVEYSCLLNYLDSGNEVFLRFDITDTDKYYAYKQSVLGENETTTFYYDENWEQFALFDEFSMDESSSNPGEVVLSYIKILKVLFCDKTQSVIYVAIHSPYSSPVYHSSRFVYFTKCGIPLCITEEYHSAFDE